MHEPEDRSPPEVRTDYLLHDVDVKEALILSLIEKRHATGQNFSMHI